MPCLRTTQPLFHSLPRQILIAVWICAKNALIGPDPRLLGIKHVVGVWRQLLDPRTELMRKTPPDLRGRGPRRRVGESGGVPLHSSITYQHVRPPTWGPHVWVTCWITWVFYKRSWPNLTPKWPPCLEILASELLKTRVKGGGGNGG